jgi:hypothetical protein
MSDTPETAEVIAKHDHILQYSNLLRYCKDMTANSEKLERERNQARQERDDLANAIRSFCTDYEAIQWGYDGDGGSARLADILFESLEKLKENKSGGV